MASSPTATRSPVSRFLTWATGAKEDEVGRVLLSFAALLFLLISYYLIKPMRNSQFLKEFDASYLPVVALGVVPTSLLLTKIFTSLADRIEKYRLVAMSYLAMMAIQAAFTWLMSSGKPAAVAFYLFASVYFLLILPATWACINDIFSSQQGERCYGFIAVGSTVGGIMGSKVSSLLSQSAWRDYPTLVSAGFMGISLALILTAARKRRLERGQQAITTPGNGPSGAHASQGFWRDVGDLVRIPFVRRIGLSVVALAMFNSGLDYISSRAIDEGVSRSQFQIFFADFEPETFDEIAALKGKKPSDRSDALRKLGATTGKGEPEMSRAYKDYQNACEAQNRAFFSDVYTYQGLLGIFMLLVVARLVFANLGLRYAAVILPTLALGGVIAFAFPIDLIVVEWVMVIIGATNYSLNNAAKEILYTSTGEETKFKHKPIIEGPFLRAGDGFAALCSLGLTYAAIRSGLGAQAGQWAFLAGLLVAIAFWFRAAYLAGYEYDTVRKFQDDPPPPQDDADLTRTPT